MVGVAVNVTLVPAPGQMSVVFAAMVTLGVTLVVTVTVLLAVASLHPPVPVTVYVIVAVPAAIGVITPVFPSMVATAALLVVHAPPVSPLLVNVTVALEHNDWLPDIVPALGGVITAVVIPLLVAVLAVWQRLLAVNTTVTSSLLASVVVVNIEELVPVLVPFTFH